MRSGTIFDIRRFSTHDGTGIRTTLFLKGCPLSCVWCHNPEGMEAKPRVIWFQNKCMGCGCCAGLARQGGVRLESAAQCGTGVRLGKKVVRLAPEKQEDWEQIIAACPTNALVMDAREISAEEAVQELLRDLPFFRHGGGVTFSGGEPLLQAAFVLEILKKLKEYGIHTAIETSLCADWGRIEPLLPLLDQIYADFKLADEEAHRRYTGVSNQRIRANLRRLLTSEHRHKVTIRTPMIPGITTEKGNIQAIAGYISGLFPEVRYELLNWNPLAEAKYHLVDKEFCFQTKIPKYREEEMRQFAQIAREAGAVHVCFEA